MGQQKQKLGLEQEIEYLNFINSLLSKATIAVYRQAISHYMQFINITKASSLIEQDTKTIE